MAASGIIHGAAFAGVMVLLAEVSGRIGFVSASRSFPQRYFWTVGLRPYSASSGSHMATMKLGIVAKITHVKKRT